MTNAQWREKILYVAKKNIGYGEETANNEGHYLELIGSKPGYEWCAVFAGYCYRRSFELLNPKAEHPPLWLYRNGNLNRAEPGAKALAKLIGKNGVRFLDPLQALPGDVVSWHRGFMNLKGHIGIIEKINKSGSIYTIEGNVGRFPAVVHRLSHDVNKEKLFTFAGVRD